MQRMTKEIYEQTEKMSYKSLFVGIPQIDTNGGITDHDCTVIAGSTGSGKSLVALFMACNLAKYGNQKVVFFNVENDIKLMTERMKDLGFDYNKDFGEFDKNGENRLVLMSGKNMKFEMIQSAIIQYQPKALFLDLFSSLMDNQSSFMVADFTLKYAIEISEYPKQYKCSIFVTEQLIKDNRRTHRPVINDIQGGKGLPNKATKVIMVYRYVKENLERSIKQPVSSKVIINTTELLLRKNRMKDTIPNFMFLQLENKIGFVPLTESEEIDYTEYVFNRKN
jgi:replicative DNA helicase